MATEYAHARRVEQAEHDSNDRSDLRDILVAVRKDAGLTVEQVADYMHVSPRDVREYERGAVDPRLSFHQRYARAVGARVEFDVETSAVPRG